MDDPDLLDSGPAMGSWLPILQFRSLHHGVTRPCWEAGAFAQLVRSQSGGPFPPLVSTSRTSGVGQQTWGQARCKSPSHSPRAWVSPPEHLCPPGGEEARAQGPDLAWKSGKLEQQEKAGGGEARGGGRRDIGRPLLSGFIFQQLPGQSSGSPGSWPFLCGLARLQPTGSLATV